MATGLSRDSSVKLSIYCICFVLSFCMPAGALAGTAFRLTSPSFQNGEQIPSEFTCVGSNRSPVLIWSDTPKNTKNLAIIVNDPDAPGGNFIHWVIYGLEPTVKGLSADAGKIPAPAPGAEEGLNDFGLSGYRGPCPPPGPPHRYHFTLFAVDSEINLPAGASATRLESAMKGHIIDKADLIGIFGR